MIHEQHVPCTDPETLKLMDSAVKTAERLAARPKRCLLLFSRRAADRYGYISMCDDAGVRRNYTAYFRPPEADDWRKDYRWEDAVEVCWVENPDDRTMRPETGAKYTSEDARITHWLEHPSVVQCQTKPNQ